MTQGLTSDEKQSPAYFNFFKNVIKEGGRILMPPQNALQKTK